MVHVFKLLLALGLMSALAFGHGGQSTVPADAGSGVQMPGVFSAPTTNPQGAFTPSARGGRGGATASVSARSREGGRVSGRGAGRGTSQRGARGASSGGNAGAEAPVAWDSWEFWWDANSAEFLSLRGRRKAKGVSSGLVSLLTGKGLRRRTADGIRPNNRMVAEQIVPALTQLMGARAGDIADSAVLALARISDPDQDPDVLDALLPQLAHKELSVRSSSALALGVLGDDRAVDALMALSRDSSRGRQLVGGGQVSSLVRCFSAISLGMLGTRDSIDCLRSLVEGLGPSERELSVAACLGLSQVPRDHARADAVLELASERLADRYTDSLLKAHLVTVVAKVGGPKHVPELLALLMDRDTDPVLRQSLALALGRVAEVSQPEAVQRLQQVIEGERDALTRHLAILALGRMGGRDPLVADHEAAHAEIESMLVRELAGKGKQSAHRSWAGLAAALYARGCGAGPRSDRIVERLAHAYGRESDPAHKGAFAVGLGLAGARSAGPDLARDLTEHHDEVFRGHLAIALGLLRERESVDDLMRLCSDPRTPATLRRKAATGLGLMGERKAVESLVSVLERAGSLGEIAGAAAALGLLGDRDAVTPLVQRATDDSAGALTRGFSAAALGLLAERSRLPFHAKLLADSHYLARTAAMSELMDIL